jgi:hypothetical protein
MLRNIWFIALVLGWITPAFSAEIITKLVPDAKIVGEGRMSVAFWDIYDATLYAPQGKLTQAKPFALSIRYMREIDGKDIADRSVQEIRGQGYTNEIRLAAWNAQMKKIFPDVEDGTVLLAIFIPNQKTIFYHGNTPIGTIRDAEFTRWFSNIWLGEKTSEPKLRHRLLGLS